MGGIFFFVYILLGAIPLLLYGSVPGPMSLLADVGYILAGVFMLINKKNIVACIGFGILALQGFLQFVNGILQFSYYVNPLSAMFFKLLGFAGMFIGVPVFAVVYSVIKKFITLKLQKKGLPYETAAYSDNPANL